MQSKKISFPNAEGQTLAGVLDLPTGRPSAYALFAHCFTCSKNLKAANHISRALTTAGIAVLRFDFTGLGQSEGAFGDTTFSSNVSDLVAAAEWLQQNHAAPEILFGHSLGGTAILQAASSIPSAVAVATIGSPSEPQHVAHMFSGSEAAFEKDGVADVTLGGRVFQIRKRFLDDLGEHNLAGAVSGLRKALLVMHAPLDDVVELDNASALFAAAKHPKSFVSLDKADHLLSNEADSRYVGRTLATWASRYVREHSSTDLSPGPGEVMARTFGDGFRTDVATSDHTWLADEPVSIGGSNLGPTPYDLLSAALATCTTMTLRMYANHKKLPLRSASVSVKHGRVHAEDCDDCVQRDGKIDEFQRELVLDGDLSAAQRKRMLEIADRCPVHRTLHNEIKVRTNLRD